MSTSTGARGHDRRLGLVPLVSSGFWSGFPDAVRVVLGSGISSTAIMAVLLNLFFNVLRPGTPKDPSGIAAAPALQITDVEMRVLAEGGTFEAGQEVPVTREGRGAALTH